MGSDRPIFGAPSFPLPPLRGGNPQRGGGDAAGPQGGPGGGGVKPSLGGGPVAPGRHFCAYPVDRAAGTRSLVSTSDTTSGVRRSRERYKRGRRPFISKLLRRAWFEYGPCRT